MVVGEMCDVLYYLIPSCSSNTGRQIQYDIVVYNSKEIVQEKASQEGHSPNIILQRTYLKFLIHIDSFLTCMYSDTVRHMLIKIR